MPKNHVTKSCPIGSCGACWTFPDSSRNIAGDMERHLNKDHTKEELVQWVVGELFWQMGQEYARRNKTETKASQE